MKNVELVELGLCVGGMGVEGNKVLIPSEMENY